jgi:diaminopimelate epimerase
MQFNFYKYQGTGNDFVLIDNRDLFFPKGNSVLIKEICDRRFGIGADGLMLLENEKEVDFRMVYYNADGNESTMCGNGGRCISAFAKKLGIVNDKGIFEAIDGKHEFIIDSLNQDVILKMIDVNEIQSENDDYILFTGSPHYVSFRKEIDKIHIVSEARKIRYNERYAKEGINVNFVEVKNNKVYMRTYERGVEDETLSCGTGTVAVALCVAAKCNKTEDHIEILTPGGNLAVSFIKEGSKFTNVWLQGPARLVFEGTINIE